MLRKPFVLVFIRFRVKARHHKKLLLNYFCRRQQERIPVPLCREPLQYESIKTTRKTVNYR
jgi:hypothetical protein